MIGMPGSGKSTIGRIASKKTGFGFMDVDAEIEKEHGVISDIFKNSGEDEFRRIEHDALAAACSNEGFIISTGGGIVERPENIDILKNETVIFIDRETANILTTLDSDSRPLLKDRPDELIALYDRRYKKYVNAMNYRIENNDSINKCVEKVIEIIKDGDNS